MSMLCAGYSQQCINQIRINQDKFGSITVMNPNNEEETLALIFDGVSLGYQSKYASYNTVLWLLEWTLKYLAENEFNVQDVAKEIQMVKYNHLLNEFSDKHSDKDSCCTVCGIVTNQKMMTV